LFHLPQDRWPHAVDVPAIARIASASAQMVLALSNELWKTASASFETVAFAPSSG
jgi:hypothetical protein